MPYRDPTARKIGNREAQRRFRERKKLEREAADNNLVHPMYEVPDDPVGALATWAAATLIVPPGHPLSGGAMVLPDYGEAFLRDSFEAHESALCMGRKNAKSAICAVLALGLSGRPAAHARLARRDCQRVEGKGGRTAQPGGGDRGGVRAGRDG